MRLFTRRAAFLAVSSGLAFKTGLAHAAGGGAARPDANSDQPGGARRRPAEFVPLGDFTVNQKSGAYRRPSYIVLSLIVETPPEDVNYIRDVLPRLRDAAFRRLVMMAERGMLMPQATDPLVVKDNVLDALSKVQTTGIRDVLITRLIHS